MVRRNLVLRTFRTITNTTPQHPASVWSFTRQRRRNYPQYHTTATIERSYRGLRHDTAMPTMDEIVSQHVPLAEKCCDFLTNSPDPFHAVKNNIQKLSSAGYVELCLREPFTEKLVKGGKYYYTLNKTTLVAFAIGGKHVAGNGFKIIGGHTDSPNLKVKPNSKRSGSGCTQLGVECYGGGLWYTWLDRDLGISGRVLVREQNGKISQKIVKIHRPIARVSSLCIHLQTSEERAALKLNKEEHLSPVLGTQSILQNGVKEQLTNGSGDTDSWRTNQEPLLFDLLAKELDVKAEDIADFELNLFDTQPASLGGIASEFLYSARLDNLATCFVAVEGLIAHTSDSDTFDLDTDISLVCLFDHEEVGSGSAHGAASPVLAEAVSRITSSLGTNQLSSTPLHDLHSQSLRKSFFLSVDQAHAVHPNYPSKHEKNHGPKMNSGVVIKTNQNQRYTTNSVTGFIMREITRKAAIKPVQEFVVRNDCPCGSTIGPIVTAATGIRAVDVGMPQLSMHSCREVMGIVDLTNGLDLFKAYFKHFREIDDSLQE